MDRKLLVRVYNVGLGDCIYVRVPDGTVDRHILIDCGNKFGTEAALKAAVDDLKTQLPEKGLDLLVVTHSHEDHVRGFDPKWFSDIKIGRIWLSAGMDPKHPQAEGARKLQAFAVTALTALLNSPRSGLAATAASLMSLSKSDGIETVQVRLPKALGIKPQYVHADTPAKDLDLFSSTKISLKVLAPMRDIDHYYLGRTDESLLQFTGSRTALTATEAIGTAAAAGGTPAATVPANISRNDFDRLQRRLVDNAMGFVLKAGHLVNNTSVVLLLEWHGRRLLFTGDAEASESRGGVFTKGAANGSWNVMWHERKADLAKPLDFLKVGHHGSFNATPWAAEGDDTHPLNAMLDAMLPKPAPGKRPSAKAVISTERTNGYKTIPAPELLKRLGARVANTRRYQESKSKGHFVAGNVDQPQRTDLEGQHAATGVAGFIDVEFEAVS
jgi:beta-lactamase superfamily II metal-dependent hydrolase